MTRKKTISTYINEIDELLGDFETCPEDTQADIGVRLEKIRKLLDCQLGNVKFMVEIPKVDITEARRLLNLADCPTIGESMEAIVQEFFLFEVGSNIDPMDCRQDVKVTRL